MNEDPRAIAAAARTLAAAHEVLVRLRPPPGDDDPARWREFHTTSAAVYREIAELDRAHHHEALYWVKREEANARARPAEHPA